MPELYKSSDDIERLIYEYNELSEVLPIPGYINSKNNDSIRILAITSNKIIGFKAEIAHILNINVGDTILYILDDHGMINVRKSTDKLILGHNEKFISINKISAGTKGYLTFKIPTDISRILKIRDNGRLIWILDDKNNVLIKNTILPDNCIIKGEILDISTLGNQQTSIPANVRDLLLIDVGDIIVFAIKDDNIILKPFADIDNLKSLGISKITTKLRVHLSKQIENFINSKDNHLLWILDMDGDIILRNTFLPKTCI